MVATVTGSPRLLLPDPLSGLAGQIVQAIGDALVKGIARAASSTFASLLDYLGSTTGAQLTHGWFASGRGRAITGTVSALAGSILLLCLLFAIVQGVMAGEPAQAFRAALIEVPRAVLTAGALVMVAQLLLDMTDVASSALLQNAPADLERFTDTYGLAASIATLGGAGGVFAIILFLASALVWVELMVRAALIYFLVAASPIVFAARVWPETRNAYRKFIELGLALIFSKVAIALALGLGAAGLGSFSTDDNTALGGLLSGAVLMIVASMTPFVLLKLIPIVEGAVVAQGISRSPARAAQSGMQVSYYAQAMQRRSGGSGGAPESGGAQETGTAAGTVGATETGAATTAGTAGGAGASAGGATAAGTTAGAAGGPPGMVVGAAVGAGVAAGVQKGKATLDHVSTSADSATAAASGTGSGDGGGGSPATPQPQRQDPGSSSAGPDGEGGS